MSVTLGEAEDQAQARKRFSDRAATAARLGVMLWRSDADDGPQRYFASYGGMVKLLPDLAAVDALLERVAGAR